MNIYNILIENSMLSNIEHEYNNDLKKMKVVQTLRNKLYFPSNDGFVLGTKFWNGKEIKCSVLSLEPMALGSIVEGKLLGQMEMTYDGIDSTLLIFANANDYRLESINKIDDIPEQWLEDLHDFYRDYRWWMKPNITIFKKWGKYQEAAQTLKQAQEFGQEYAIFKPEDVIGKLKDLYPEKYEAL